MPGFIYTYTTLLTELNNWLEVDSNEYEASYPTILGLAETRVYKDLDLETFERIKTGNMTAGNNLITKPSDENLISAQTITFTSGGEIFYLNPRSYEYCLDYWPTVATRGTPKYVAEYDETRWYVVPTPDSAYDYSVRGVVRPNVLSATNPSNFLSKNFPDLLFYACLMSSEAFLKEDQTGGRMTMWKQTYTDLLPAAQDEVLRLTREGYTMFESSLPPASKKEGG